MVILYAKGSSRSASPLALGTLDAAETYKKDFVPLVAELTHGAVGFFYQLEELQVFLNIMHIAAYIQVQQDVLIIEDRKASQSIM